MTVVDILTRPNELSIEELANMLGGDEGGVLGALATLGDEVQSTDEVVLKRQVAASLLKRRIQIDPCCITGELRKAVITGLIISPLVVIENLSSLVRTILQYDCEWPKLEQTIAQNICKQPDKFVTLLEVCAKELNEYLYSDRGEVVHQTIIAYASGGHNATIELRIRAIRALRANLEFIAVDDAEVATDESHCNVIGDEDNSLDQESLNSQHSKTMILDVLDRVENCVLKGLDEVIMTDLQLLSMGSELLKCQSALWKADAAIGGWSYRHMEDILAASLSHLSDYYTVYQRMVINAKEDELCSQDNAPVQYVLDFIQDLAEFRCAATFMKLHQILYILFLYSQLTDRQCEEMDLEDLGLVDDPYAQAGGGQHYDIRPATLWLLQLYINEDSDICKGRLTARQAAIESLGHLACDYPDTWKIEECVLYFAGVLCEGSFTVHVLHSAGAILGSDTTTEEDIGKRSGSSSLMPNGAAGKLRGRRSILLARSMSILAFKAVSVIQLFARDLVELVSRVTLILMMTKDLRVKGSAVNCLLNLSSEGSDSVVQVIDTGGILMNCERLLIEGETDVYRRLCVKALIVARGSVHLKKRIVNLMLNTSLNHEVQLNDYLEQLSGSEEVIIGRDMVWRRVLTVLQGILEDSKGDEPHTEDCSEVIGTVSARLRDQIPMALGALCSLLRRREGHHLALRKEAFEIITSPKFLEEECIGCEDICRLCLRDLLAAEDLWTDLTAPIRLGVSLASEWLAARLREGIDDSETEIDESLALVHQAYARVAGAVESGLKGDIHGFALCILDIACEREVALVCRRAALTTLVTSFRRWESNGRGDLCQTLRGIVRGDVAFEQWLEGAMFELFERASPLSSAKMVS